MAFVLDYEGSGLTVPEGYADESSCHTSPPSPGRPEGTRTVNVSGQHMSVNVPNEMYLSSVVVEESTKDQRVVVFKEDPTTEWLVIDEVGGSDDELDCSAEVCEEGGAVRAGPLSDQVQLDTSDVCEEDGAVLAGPLSDQEHLGSDEEVEDSESSLCKLCDRGVKASRRHLEQHHFPWYLCPYASCPQCEVSEQSLCFLRNRHLSEESHGAEAAFALDKDLLLWVSRMAGILHFLRSFLDQDDLDGLLEAVRSRQLAANSTNGYIFHGSWEGCLLMLDQYLGIPEHGPHSVDNPMCVSSVLHWRTLANILMVLPAPARDLFRRLDDWANINGQVAVVISPWLTFPQAYDAHCHLDKVLEAHNINSLEGLREQFAGNRVVTRHVSNFVFPIGWNNHRQFDANPEVLYTFGVHPRAVSRPYNLQQLENLLQHEKAVAIGELGFTLPAQDFYRQEICVRRQLEIAKEKHLPIVIHCQGQGSHEAMLEILPEYISPASKIQLHCFNGDITTAQRYLKLTPQVIFSISGLALIAPSPELQQVIQSLDLSTVVLETDAPFLAPPGTGYHLNHSWNIFQTADLVARLKNVPPRIILEATRLNAERFFGR